MEYRRLYIAYGSNINLEQMAYRCPNSKIVSKEMLKGYELEFRGVATIVPNDKSEVPVLIWEIDGRDEHSLDKYEGFPNYYRKELFEIDVNGEKKEWFCQYHLTHFIRTRIMQRERYDHSRAFFELPEAAHRWRCRFFC